MVWEVTASLPLCSARQQQLQLRAAGWSVAGGRGGREEGSSPQTPTLPGSPTGSEGQSCPRGVGTASHPACFLVCPLGLKFSVLFLAESEISFSFLKKKKTSLALFCCCSLFVCGEKVAWICPKTVLRWGEGESWGHAHVWVFPRDEHIS